MVKGKLEMKVTLDIELTDSVIKALETTPEEVKEMIEDGSIVKVFQESSEQNPYFALLGKFTYEQISAEAHDV